MFGVPRAIGAKACHECQQVGELVGWGHDVYFFILRIVLILPQKQKSPSKLGLFIMFTFMTSTEPNLQTRR
ncbi:hypothetical protein [Moraxella lacunata]|uniref:hypothetical protein n=1 Tax=Moraxella lacunata TaxID=477 RepID=UPI003EDFA0D5